MPFIAKLLRRIKEQSFITHSIIVTIWSDELGTTSREKMINEFIAKLTKQWPSVKIILNRARCDAELEFPGEHGFGTFSGRELWISPSSINPAELKEFALKNELIDGQRIADIDVYEIDTRTQALKKYTRNGKFRFVKYFYD